MVHLKQMGIVTFEVLKEKEKAIKVMCALQEEIDKPEPKLRFRVFRF